MLFWPKWNETKQTESETRKTVIIYLQRLWDLLSQRLRDFHSEALELCWAGGIYLLLIWSRPSHPDLSVAQMVKNLPAVQETWAKSLGQENTLEKEMATQFSFLAWEIPWQRSLAGCSSWGYKESDTAEQLTLSDSDLPQTGRYFVHDLGGRLTRGHFVSDKSVYLSCPMHVHSVVSDSLWPDGL